MSVTGRTGHWIWDSAGGQDDRVKLIIIIILKQYTLNNVLFTHDLLNRRFVQKFGSLAAGIINKAVYNIQRLVGNREHPVSTFGFYRDINWCEKIHNVVIIEFIESGIEKTPVSGNIHHQFFQRTIIGNVTSAFTGY